MAKKARLPQSRHHILVFDEDWEFLMQNYGPGTEHAQLGVSGVIREVIHQRVLGMKAKVNHQLDAVAAAQQEKADRELEQV